MGATGTPENDSEDGMLAEMRITVARAQVSFTLDQEKIKMRSHILVLRSSEVKFWQN